MTAGDDVRLKHIRDAASEAVSYVEGRNRKMLDEDRQLALSLVKLIEIIGEAAARTSQEIQAAHSDLPWSEMIATRNRLIHGYDDIDLDIVWRVVTDDLPPLLMRLQEILGDRPA